MSRSTANVSFYCRESKKNKDGLAPIEMVIILNTRRCFIQLPRKEYPETTWTACSASPVPDTPKQPLSRARTA